MKRQILALLLASSLAVPAVADERHHQSGALNDGEVRKVDKDAKKITIKHGPMEKLEMPAMTMLKVRSASELDRTLRPAPAKIVNVGGKSRRRASALITFGWLPLGLSLKSPDIERIMSPITGARIRISTLFMEPLPVRTLSAKS